MNPIKYYYYPIEFLNKDIENISVNKNKYAYLQLIQNKQTIFNVFIT